MPNMQRMKRELGLREVTFPQCALGGKFQKMTTLWYSPVLRKTLDNLHMCVCKHDRHAEVARGQNQDRRWKSAEAAAYPAQMNQLLATAMNDAVEDIISNNRVDLRPAVHTWRSVGRDGRLYGEQGGRRVAAEDLNGLQQVHVWEQNHLPHSKEEQEWRERQREGTPPPVMWSSGKVVDVNFLRDEQAPNKGAVNPGDWAWHYGVTDRTRKPVKVSTADVFHLYSLMLSHLHTPPRTFDPSAVHDEDAAEHTT